MTRKVFWDDPYLTTHSTTVHSVSGSDIELESTIFYAEAGGQESDEGSIGDYQVKKATKNGKQITYTLEDSHNLQVGDPVEVKIDWSRRYQLMRLHFAAEVVLELFYKQLAGIEKTGAHIAAHKARIDFHYPDGIRETIPLVQEKGQDLINQGLPIISAFSDENTERRYWKVEGFSQVPCGGTHLKTTDEVGTLRLKRKNLGKGKERVEIFVEDA